MCLFQVFLQIKIRGRFKKKVKQGGCLSTLTLSILTLSRMTLSKVSFSDFLRNDYLDHFVTFGENFDFDTFKNDTFESV